MFVVLENEGVEKFEKSWHELLEATQGQLDDKKSEPPTMSDCATASTTWQNPLRDKRDKRMPRIAGPCSVVIFGVTGDLARKKLMPAIYDLANRGLLPPSFALVGFARRDWADEDFAKVVLRRGQAARPHPVPPGGLGPAGRRHPVRAGHFRRRRRRSSTWPRRWRSSTPSAGPAAITRSTCRFRRRRSRRCSSSCPSPGLANKPEGSWSRVVIEKPFGHDLNSAEDLNAVVNSVFPESSVFRIDHYLGKETVQNILALRFANELFEPIWNAHYVDHVQITMAEDIGLGGRGGYYDGVGAARDVIQNHLLQLLALTAMEEPVSFSPAELQAEKIKVLSATRLAEPLDETTSRGQYTAGWQGGEQVVGLLDEEGFSKTSTTETFAAITAGRRHPALGRCPVLPAHRKTPGPQGHRDRADLQAGPTPAVRRHHDRRARTERSGDPGAARRGHHAALRVQGAGQHDGSPRRQHGLLVRVGVRRGVAGGLRTPDPRRAAR